MANRIIGVFDSLEQADDALKRLVEAGFPGRDIAILGKNEEQKVGTSEDDINQEMTKHGMIGGVTGLLLDVETFLMRGMGDSLTPGTTNGLHLNPIGGSAAGSLTDVGLPSKERRQMEAITQSGRYAVCVPADGDAADIAKAVLRQAGGRLDSI